MAVKAASFSETISALGSATATITVKVPGTFATPNYKSTLFSGRNLLQFAAWLENRQAGDSITTAQIIDIDNVLGAGANYVIRSLLDGGEPPDNQEIDLLPGEPFKIMFPKDEPDKTMVPSGLYIQIVFTKASNISADLAVVNIEWDDLT